LSSEQTGTDGRLIIFFYVVIISFYIHMDRTDQIQSMLTFCPVDPCDLSTDRPALFAVCDQSCRQNADGWEYTYKVVLHPQMEDRHEGS